MEMFQFFPTTFHKTGVDHLHTKEEESVRNYTTQQSQQSHNTLDKAGTNKKCAKLKLQVYVPNRIAYIHLYLPSKQK